jgi:hypothetical protein
MEEIEEDVKELAQSGSLTVFICRGLTHSSARRRICCKLQI